MQTLTEQGVTWSETLIGMFNKHAKGTLYCSEETKYRLDNFNWVKSDSKVYRAGATLAKLLNTQ